MKKGDLLLYFCALLLAFAPLLTLLAPKAEPACAVVRIDGKTVCSLPLDRDAQQTFSTGRGENTVQIRDGTVCILSADCPDGTCVRMGAIFGVNETLVCLPHRLTVTIEGAAQQGSPDAVTQ